MVYIPNSSIRNTKPDLINTVHSRRFLSKHIHVINPLTLECQRCRRLCILYFNRTPVLAAISTYITIFPLQLLTKASPALLGGVASASIGSTSTELANSQLPTVIWYARVLYWYEIQPSEHTSSGMQGYSRIGGALIHSPASSSQTISCPVDLWKAMHRCNPV